MEHEPGGRAVVPGVQAFGQGAYVDALGVQFLDGPQTLGVAPYELLEELGQEHSHRQSLIITHRPQREI